MWSSAPELASNQTVIQHVFLVVDFVLQLDFIIAMIHTLPCQICILLIGQSVALINERLPVLIQMVCFCSSGKGAPTLFKPSEPKLKTIYSSFPEPSLTASERLNPFCKSIERTNLRSQKTIQLFEKPDA